MLIGFIWIKGVLNDKPIIIDEMGVLEEHVKSAYDWRCVVMALETDNPMQTFFLGKLSWLLRSHKWNLTQFGVPEIPFQVLDEFWNGWLLSKWVTC